MESLLNRPKDLRMGMGMRNIIASVSPTRHGLWAYEYENMLHRGERMTSMLEEIIEFKIDSARKMRQLYMIQFLHSKYFLNLNFTSRHL
jgi:hypothetical protein